MNQETSPREDGELVGEILAAADLAIGRLDGRGAEEVLRADPETSQVLAECATRIGEAAREISEMMRNWASHIPWEAFEELGTSQKSDIEVERLCAFLREEFPRTRADMEEMWEPGHLRNPVDPDEEFALDKNAYDFYRPAGRDLMRRTEDFHDWVEARRRTETWQYSRVLEQAPGNNAVITNDLGRRTRGINFNSQDYLSFNAHPAIREAAAKALRDYGPHSAGSPMVLGNTTISNELEKELGELTGAEHVTLFPTGWAAGFGTIAGLVRPEDHVVIDRLAHSCLQQGARAATRNVYRYEHLSVDAVRGHLRDIRARDPRSGILVVTDGLFSVDADWPDLAALQAVCREHDATLLVDVAHDLGATGPGGSGVIGTQGMLGEVDLVMGAFSKSFASNGGFLASKSPAVKQYVKMFGGSHFFSNALSPMQTAVVLQATRIIRSPEGDELRGQLFQAIDALRDELSGRGLTCMGVPSPIVPLLIGNEKLARVTNRLLFDQGVLAFMVEFPVTPTGSSRFRLQVQAAHRPEEAREAARIIDRSIAEARSYLSSAFGNDLV
ncbi:aminotransferase class I/II-fold pyridoxal phosphate-dependent enzyme [Streptomyces sp. SL13]|uniref:8-amino-7-oxononanoate synthase n=1 Tax=Streptantibioticus silvisoli TaxID=2705255 RepID=A0AA90GTI0_9ACTN|nr:aminotransferase class I/II-fold pyridoxal phosphate-dependent enzyme [Streptantibioticus silvisoli]MDI5967773.1 aminotransferase class I/II-fold pyridoxal phosphate-dependent enzyme [Streptantibioticus silvisoli]